MQMNRRMALALLTVALLAVSGLSAASASAKTPMVSKALTSTIAPSVPTDPMLHGVAPGSAPWVIKNSTMQLLNNGVLTVNIQGLVIPELGTAGPVTTVDVSLFCANHTTPDAVSANFKLSEKGNAFFVTRIGVPRECTAPVALINPNGITSIYIATAGINKPAKLPISVFTSSLEPSQVTGPMLHGVAPGPAPWVIGNSSVQINGNGQVTVNIQGLVIPELGTPGPVTSVDAALYCAEDTMAAAVTPTAPLNEKGNATINATVTLPEKCHTPVVLINPLGISSIYIAETGFEGITGANE
jgi:hypothetical protein